MNPLNLRPLGDPLFEVILRAPEPPKTCPWCGHQALLPSRDSKGLWTWCCQGGCNP